MHEWDLLNLSYYRVIPKRIYVPMLEKQKKDEQIQITCKFPGRAVVFLPFSRDDVFSDFKLKEFEFAV